MAFSLEKIDMMFGQVKMMELMMAELDEEFKDETNCEDYMNPFHTNEKIKALIGEIKADLESFLLNQYRRTFCPNVPVSQRVGDISKWFDKLEFNAVKFVKKVNEKVLGDTEKLAYENLRQRAQCFSRSKNNFDVKGKIFKGYISLNYTVGGVRPDFRMPQRIIEFETFVNLILDNQSLLSPPVSPTQIKHAQDIGFTLDNGPRKTIPLTLYGTKHIEKAVFFKNGNVNMYFRTSKDVAIIAGALSGNEPNIPFPEHKIDMRDLFRPPDTGPKRIVNRRRRNGCKA